MKKVCVVVTARPSYSRVKTVLLALQKTPGIELQVVAAASALLTRYGAVVDVMRKDGIEITAEVACVLDGSGTRESAISTGLLTAQLATLFSGLRPQIIVTIADRHETLATAIAASYQNIPLCHLQGGEHTGSIDEKVRWAVSELADLHLVATEAAKDELLRSPSIQGPIVLTGCPSIDLAREAYELGPVDGHEFVALFHPVTNDPDAGGFMRQVIRRLGELSKDVAWFWPGEDAGSEAMAKELRLAGIHAKRNLDPVDFLRLLLGSGCLVGNSSVGIRESSFLGVRVVDVGNRQHGRERAPSVVSVADPRDIPPLHPGNFLLSPKPRGTNLYGDGHAAEKCVAAILDYLQ